jgi:hypothetical protein
VNPKPTVPFESSRTDPLNREPPAAFASPRIAPANPKPTVPYESSRTDPLNREPPAAFASPRIAPANPKPTVPFESSRTDPLNREPPAAFASPPPPPQANRAARAPGPPRTGNARGNPNLGPRAGRHRRARMHAPRPVPRREAARSAKILASPRSLRPLRLCVESLLSCWSASRTRIRPQDRVARPRQPTATARFTQSGHASQTYPYRSFEP